MPPSISNIPMGPRASLFQGSFHSVKFKSFYQVQQFDVQERIRSNHFAQDEVVRLIKATEKDLAEYDLELGRLHSAIIALENRKQELRAQHESLKSLLIPVRKLSTEVLSLIFSHCEPATYFGAKIQIPGQHIARVCAYWRNVAHSTPSLWTNLSFDIRAPLDDETLSHKVASLLQLSRLSLLSVTIIDSSTETRDVGPLRPPLGLILGESHRFQSLVLRLPYLASTMTFWDIPALDCSNLQHIDVDLFGDGSRGENPPISVFANAAKLTSVVLRRAYSGDITLPWSQVYDFRQAVSRHTSWSMIQRCTNARSFATTRMGLSRRYQPGPFEHRTLSSLTVELGQQEKYFECFKDFISNATAKSLISLDIISLNGRVVLPSATDWDKIRVDLLKFTLQSLTLQNIFLTTPDLAVLLQGVPLLRRLELIDRAISNRETLELVSDAVLDVLLRGRAPSSYARSNLLVPELEHLTLEGAGGRISDEKIMGFVRSRWVPFEDGTEQGVTTARSLRALRIKLRRTINVSKISQLVHLATAGLAVTVIDTIGVLMDIIPPKPVQEVIDDESCSNPGEGSQETNQGRQRKLAVAGPGCSAQ
jgi:hypothetical protein